MKSFAVIGMGLFGSEIASKLYERGKDVLAMDTDAERIDNIADHVSKAVVADARKRDILLQLGVDKCDCAIVAMTSDLSASVLITMNLEAIGVKHIICKATDETDKEILEKLGANEVIISEKITADKLCRNLIFGNIIEYVALSDNCSIVEIKVPGSWVGKTIVELNVRAKHGINVIAIKNKMGISAFIDINYMLAKDDSLLLIGDADVMTKIERLG
ncbi:MAG: TrkA family potassium uptake protein [Lachnospiraceae bacterium]|nr:TrkA family potassium uptake protein [Lachnospiraceae bacterium]